MSDTQILFVLPGLHGGGAEHVASVLANAFTDQGLKVAFVLTSQKSESIVKNELHPEIGITSLRDISDNQRKLSTVLIRFVSSVVCRSIELFHASVPPTWACLSFWSEYQQEIGDLRKLLEKQPDATVIAFLQPAIPISLLAARGLPNRVIVSERGNPLRLMKSRYGRRFIEKYYTRADALVFQTQEAMKAYPSTIAEKGTVIPNPIPGDLPAPYHGERNRNITTFCRISAQKNLSLMLKAFQHVHQEHPEYRLRIIGDAINENDKIVEKRLHSFVKNNEMEDAVSFEPFREDVLNAVIHDAMYVNSSDYEGISNAMLEAMAIGMPVICTDCPIGGARQTIQDHVNGLLVPTGDVNALEKAMNCIINDSTFAEKISKNAAKLRQTLDSGLIIKKWIMTIQSEVDHAK